MAIDQYFHTQISRKKKSVTAMSHEKREKRQSLAIAQIKNKK